MSKDIRDVLSRYEARSARMYYSIKGINDSIRKIVESNKELAEANKCDFINLTEYLQEVFTDVNGTAEDVKEIIEIILDKNG